MGRGGQHLLALGIELGQLGRLQVLQLLHLELSLELFLLLWCNDGAQHGENKTIHGVQTR